MGASEIRCEKLQVSLGQTTVFFSQITIGAGPGVHESDKIWGFDFNHLVQPGYTEVEGSGSQRTNYHSYLIVCMHASGPTDYIWKNTVPYHPDLTAGKSDYENIKKPTKQFLAAEKIQIHSIESFCNFNPSLWSDITNPAMFTLTPREDKSQIFLLRSVAFFGGGKK